MKKNIIKVLLDIAMTICLICLMSTKITGMFFHEIIGIGIFILVLLHNMLNMKWIRDTTNRLFSNKVKYKDKINYIFNLVLMCLITVVFISGMMVSVTIFRDIGVENRELVSIIHKRSARITFLLIVVHVLLHFKCLYIKSKYEICKLIRNNK